MFTGYHRHCSKEVPLTSKCGACTMSSPSTTHPPSQDPPLYRAGNTTFTDPPHSNLKTPSTYDTACTSATTKRREKLDGKRAERPRSSRVGVCHGLAARSGWGSGLAGAGGGELAAAGTLNSHSLVPLPHSPSLGAPTAAGTTTTPPPLSALALTRPQDLTSATL